MHQLCQQTQTNDSNNTHTNYFTKFSLSGWNRVVLIVEGIVIGSGR